MDMKQLEIFVTACERGSFSQAAACMYMIQPNISKSIRALEHELGRPLLIRNAKGVQPTAYGKTVLEHAQMILKTAATISSLAIPDEQNHLSLSTYPSNMVARLLVDFYQTWGSDIHIEHHEGTVEEITDHVHQGISEVGIVYVAKKQTGTFQHILSHKKLEFIPQSEKSICVYVGPNHPLYHADSVDFSDLPYLKFIRGVRDFFSMEHHLETVVLLSHKKADSYIHIDVEFGEGEGKIPVDSIAKRAEAYKPKEKVTYKMIKEYIEAKYGFKVHTAYIAEVKRNLGLPMYDAPNAVEELKQPRKHPTPEKVEAIKDALRYFAVI